MAENPDICDVTLLLRQTCYHCNPSPRYKLREFVNEGGHRMVEILKNGGPVHPYDKHFQFGTKKAELILAALPIIREFASNTHEDGTTTVALEPYLIDLESGFGISVRVEMHEEFEHSSGEHIQRPWLHIEAVSKPTALYIGLGLQKSQAICALSNELRDWVARGKAQRQRSIIRLGNVMRRIGVHYVNDNR